MLKFKMLKFKMLKLKKLQLLRLQRLPRLRSVLVPVAHCGGPGSTIARRLLLLVPPQRFRLNCLTNHYEHLLLLATWRAIQCLHQSAATRLPWRAPVAPMLQRAGRPCSRSVPTATVSKSSLSRRSVRSAWPRPLSDPARRGPPIAAARVAVRAAARLTFTPLRPRRPATAAARLKSSRLCRSYPLLTFGTRRAQSSRTFLRRLKPFEQQPRRPLRPPWPCRCTHHGGTPIVRRAPCAAAVVS